MPDHTIQQGEGISLLGELYGLAPKTIWDHPANAGLRSKRKDPDILMPGDVLFIPEVRGREHPVLTDRRHIFRRKGTPAYLRLQFFHGSVPRSHVPFRLELENSTFEGFTDSNGVIEMFVPCGSRTGTVSLGSGIFAEHFVVRIGELDPANEMQGVQKRLSNLGLFAGEIDGKESPNLTAAIAAFQKRAGIIPASGRLDDRTRKQLETAHDTTELLMPPERGGKPPKP